MNRLRRVFLIYQMIRTISWNQLFYRALFLVKRYTCSNFSWLLRRYNVKDQLLGHELINAKLAEATIMGFGKLDVYADKVTFRCFGETLSLSNSIDWRYQVNKSETTHLFQICFHSMEYLVQVDDVTFNFMIDQWIKSNPIYHHRYWHSSWNSYALSIRCITWMQQYVVRIKKNKFLTSCTFIASLLQQIRFLYRNLEKDLGGNHLIKNIKALVLASYFFSGDESDNWRKTASQLLKDELDNQILPDGMHFERSPSYHNEVLADLLDCYRLLEDHKILSSLEKAIIEMGKVSVNLTRPDGSPYQFNDGMMSAGRLTEILGEMSKLGFSLPTRNACYSYPQAGYSGLFESDSSFAIKHGKIAPENLPGHGHGDVFSFEWAIDGNLIVVDKGVVEYEVGSRRDSSRSTLSHNTVAIDGRDQCEFWASFRSGRKPLVKSTICVKDRQLVMVGEHDGYRRLPGRPIHRRQLTATLESLSVTDTVEGGIGQPAKAALLFHPGCKLHRRGKLAIISRNDIKLCLETSATIEFVENEWYPEFGKSVLTTQIVINYGSVPGVWKFKIYRV